MRRQGTIRRRRGERGVELVEFALVMALLTPLLLGSVGAGLNLIRSIQVVQVCRDSGHMFSRGVDFSDPGNQVLIERLAHGLDIRIAGGTGVVILSTVLMVGPDQCAAGGVPTGSCTNLNQPVIVKRVVIGNAGARASAFGTPPPSIIDANGNVQNYLTNTGARATGFNAVLPLQPGDTAYVSEVYVPSADYSFLGSANSGVYCRTFF
ncbi:MAG: hypothetical protein K6T61_13430 [Bryobacteraceae bacterium]|nr:hypothetical protein [Bryobacteraceae bacterium]